MLPAEKMLGLLVDVVETVYRQSRDAKKISMQKISMQVSQRVKLQKNGSRELLFPQKKNTTVAEST